MREASPSPFARYAVAVASIAVAAAVRILLDPILGGGAPLVTIFLFGVLASAWFGGFGPALLASLLGILASAWYDVPPRYAFAVHGSEHWAELVLYGVVSLGTALLGGAMHRARRRAEADAAAFDAERERLRVTLESIGDAVVTTDVRGRVTSMNEVAAALTGWSAAEAAGRPLDDVFVIENEQTGEPAVNPVGRVLAEGRVVGLANHTRLVSRQGDRRPIDDSAAPIRDRAGAVLGVVLVFRDVSASRRAEEAQALLAAVVESSEDAIVTKTLDGVITSWNAGAERLFGHTAAEAIGRPITIVIPPERHAEEHAIIARLRAGERVPPFETVRVTKDGRRVDISLTVSPVRDASGRIIGASKVARDVTARNRAERAVRESEERFRALTSNAPAAIFVKDLDGRYTLANPLACRALGRPDVVGLTDHDLLPAPAAEALRRRDLEVIAAGRAIESEELVSRPGYARRFLSVKFPLFGAEGPVGVCGVAIDVTDRARAEEALRAADRRKDLFLATLAHELRNPIAPLRNSIEIMKRAPGDPALLARAQATMDRQLRHLERLVDDLVDVARISRDQLELRRERVALASVVDHAVEACQPALAARGLALELDVAAEPVHLDADPVRLGQVLVNLLSNACKYTDPGGRIRVAAGRDGSDAVLAVRDTGAGIPADMLERVFDVFTQLAPSPGRQPSGLGIGLTLVRRLVEMHGGTVEARSDGPGRGSEFVVRIPALASAAEEPRPAALGVEAPAARRRVLIVDDNADAADSLATLVELIGHETHVARDGTEALALAARLRPDVVLLDIGLPSMNGHDVARRIRAEPWGETMTLVALTGWGQPEDRRRSRAVGFDHHLVKPVDVAVLARLLAAG